MNVQKTLIRQLIPNAGTIVVVTLMLLAQRAWAGPTAQGVTPGVMSYQGYLTDAVGQPMSPVNMTFRLYAQPSGGTALWTEAHTGSNAVPVTNGLFNVLLGSLNPIPSTVWSYDELYLGVQVGSDPEMTPREQVGRVPYAMAASHALTADSATKLRAPDGDPADAVTVDNSGRVGIGTTSPDRRLTIQGSGSASEWISFKDNAGVTQWHLNYSGTGLNFAETGVVDWRLFLDDGGNVGIGKSNPGAKLDVNGNVNADGLLIDGRQPIIYQKLILDYHRHYYNVYHLGNGLSNLHWVCAVVGFRAHGDFDENQGEGDIIAAYAEPWEGEWRIHVDFTQEGDILETWDVYYMCFDRDMVEWLPDWND
jgi:hypothetical protein